MSEPSAATKAIDNQFAKDVSKTATKANITGCLLYTSPSPRD